MSGVDKARMRAAFSRRAPDYEGGAALQREVAHRLAAVLREADPEAAPPGARVLDVGCGTGAMLLALGAGGGGAPGLAAAAGAAAGRGAAEEGPGAGAAIAAGVDLAHGMLRVAARALPAARLAGGDAEALPFRDAAFDLVASASAFQWLPDLAPALAEARRVLRPGGTLALALFCGETLRELRAAWRDALPAGATPSTHRFHAPAAVREALLRAGLAPLRFEAERRVVRHASVLELLESLRGIGAGNAVAGRGGGLGLRRAVREATRLYEERHGDGGGVPATWDVAYAVARRA